MSAVDLCETGRFLNLLAPGETEFTFQTFAENKKQGKQLTKIMHGTLAQHAKTLSLMNECGAGIFVSVNRTDLNGRKAANVVAVRALFVDLDGAPLEPVMAAPVPPDLVVESSAGRYHAYWLVSDVPLEQFKPIQQALAARYGGDPSVCDLPRVLRLPGFIHRKAARFQTRILKEGCEYGSDLI